MWQYGRIPTVAEAERQGQAAADMPDEGILTDLRDNYDKRDKHLGSIKIVFEEDGTEDSKG